MFSPELCSQQELLLESDKDKIPQRQEEDIFLEATTFLTSLPEIFSQYIFTICPTFYITVFFSDSTLFAVQSGRGVAQKSEPCKISSLTLCLL